MEYNGIGEKNYQIMRNYLKKKDPHSFKKFVAVRGEIIKVITDNMKMYISNKEDQKKISLEIEKKFTKENFQNLYWVDLWISSRHPVSVFEILLMKISKN